METQDTEQLADVCAALGVTITSKLARNQTREGWGEGSTHWRCTLTYKPKSGAKPRRITTPFSQGSAFTEQPTAADVLGSLLLDASTSRDSLDVDDYAANYCEGLKISETLRLYRQSLAAHKKITEFLGAHRERCERAEH